MVVLSRGAEVRHARGRFEAKAQIYSGISDVPGPVHMALGRLARARLTNVNIIARRRSRMMKLHEFTLIASGLDPEAEDFEDRFQTGRSDRSEERRVGNECVRT